MPNTYEGNMYFFTFLILIYKKISRFIITITIYFAIIKLEFCFVNYTSINTEVQKYKDLCKVQ